jgi:hypothetical protein
MVPAFVLDWPPELVDVPDDLELVHAAPAKARAPARLSAPSNRAGCRRRRGGCGWEVCMVLLSVRGTGFVAWWLEIG